MPNAIEIATIRKAPMSLGILRQVITAVPLFAVFDVRTVEAIRFSTLVIDGIPDVDPFVNLGDGFKTGRASLALRKFDCSYLGGFVKVQLDVANVWQMENRELDYDYFTLQASERIKSDLMKIEKQMIYGRAESAKGFPGLRQMTPGTIAANVMAMTDTPDDTDFTKSVINAGGTTSNAGSSVYSIQFGSLAVQAVIGGTSSTGELFQFGERRIQSLPPDASKPDELAEFEIGQYSGYMGLSVAGFSESESEKVKAQYCVRRLTNLTNQTDCGVDDYKLEKLINSHPDENRPSILAMSHRSGDQWANSRKSTGSVVFVGNMGSGRDGVINRAPKRPTEYEGVPVVYTRAVRNNDAIDVAA
jgi:hypothetical protein